MDRAGGGGSAVALVPHVSAILRHGHGYGSRAGDVMGCPCGNCSSDLGHRYGRDRYTVSRWCSVHWFGTSCSTIRGTGLLYWNDSVYGQQRDAAVFTAGSCRAWWSRCLRRGTGSGFTPLLMYVTGQPSFGRIRRGRFVLSQVLGGCLPHMHRQSLHNRRYHNTHTNAYMLAWRSRTSVTTVPLKTKISIELPGRQPGASSHRSSQDMTRMT